MKHIRYTPPAPPRSTTVSSSLCLSLPRASLASRSQNPENEGGGHHDRHQAYPGGLIHTELPRTSSEIEIEHSYHGAGETTVEGSSTGRTVGEMKTEVVSLNNPHSSQAGNDEGRGCGPAIVPSAMAGITELAETDGAIACAGTGKFGEVSAGSSVIGGHGREKEREQGRRRILACRILRTLVSEADRRAVAAALWRWRSEAMLARLENRRQKYRRETKQVMFCGSEKDFMTTPYW